LLLTIGIGTVVGSAISLAVLGLSRTGCEGERQRSMSLVGTGLVGGIGLSLAIGGGVGLSRLPGRTRMTIPSSGSMIGLGAGAALGGFLHAFAIGLPQALCPISS
jgi:hypothetical protein